jgi:hypothetical protein
MPRKKPLLQGRGVSEYAPAITCFTRPAARETNRCLHLTRVNDLESAEYRNWGVA